MAHRTGLESPVVTVPSSELSWASTHRIHLMLEGTALLDETPVRLRVGLPSAFPCVLPYIQLVSVGTGPKLGGMAHVGTGPKLGGMAHVGIDGDICYSPTRDLTFDPAQPVATLQEALTWAQRTVRDGLKVADNTGVLDEFTSYWWASPGLRAFRIDAYFTPDERVRTVHAWRAADRQVKDQGRRKVQRRSIQDNLDPLIAVADDPQAPAAFDPLSSRPFGLPRDTALYIPLKATPGLLPPEPASPWTAADLRSIVRASLEVEALGALDRLLETRRSKRDVLLLGVPRPGRSGPGRYGLVAVQLSGMRNGHVLGADSDLNGTVSKQVLVKRRDQALLMRRGGSDDQLAGRRVLLLGCGALGGHFAFALASAGIGHLTLVDPDRFSLVNTYRHVLGRRFVGQEKTSSLAQALQERFPYLAVQPEFNRTEHLLNEGRLDLTAFDLIVDATGTSTHHLMLADRLRSQPGHPPVLLTWLEALGLGGHVMTVLPGALGCPRCLYSEPGAELFNSAAFSAAGQELGSDALGCGDYHTPFSDLDALRTVELAARVGVSMLQGREALSLLRSWKGDETAFVAAGYRLSARFRQVKRKHLRQGVAYACHACPNCGAP